jgi:hypothetical protein
MTLAKRLLLGSAAAVVATTGAQAADLGLPVAPAVDYVQICSIGSFTGFILPGSDVCFDISGFARAQADFGAVNTALVVDSDDVDFSSEIELNFDARTMTEWGLLRGFIRLGESDEGEDYGLDVVKAFVQIGGFTAGLTDSFFDPVYTDYAMAGLGVPDGGTDDLALFGYSYAVGNGVTLMASVEDNDGNDRYGGILVATTNGTAVALPVISGGTTNFQDEENGLAFVAAIRVDQAWGSAKLAGALTQVDTDSSLIVPLGLPYTDETELGWAIQASAEFNLPVGVDSELGLFGIYTDGAISYAGIGTTTSAGLDLSLDAIVSDTGELQTTTAWALGAGVEFGLNAMTDLEFDGYYVDVDHGDAAGAVGDYSAYGIRGSVAYRPVSGLEFRAGVGYTGYDVDSLLDDEFDDGFTGRFRVTRSF